MKPNWTVEIREPDLPRLKRRLLGLTMVERRLREAKRSGVSKVFFVTAEPGQVPIRLRSPNHCAPYEIGRDRPTGPNVPVPLMALVDPESPTHSLLDLSSEEAFASARQYLKREIVRKSGAGWVARNLNKPVSLRLSPWLAATPVTPNLWTAFNLLVGLLAAYFVSRPGYANGLAGGLLFQLASIFDGVDGELAKFRLETSRLGGVLDSFVDNTSLIAFLGGIFLFVTSKGVPYASPFVVLGILALLFSAGIIVVVWRFVASRYGNHSLVAFDQRFLRTLPAGDPLVRWALRLKDLIKKDCFSLVFCLLCAVAFREGVLYLAALGSAVGFGMVVALSFRYSGQAPQTAGIR